MIVDALNLTVSVGTSSNEKISSNKLFISNSVSILLFFFIFFPSSTFWKFNFELFSIVDLATFIFFLISTDKGIKEKIKIKMNPLIAV